MCTFDILKTLLNGQNQFASGGLLLMIVGGIAAYLRALPWRCWAWRFCRSEPADSLPKRLPKTRWWSGRTVTTRTKS